MLESFFFKGLKSFLTKYINNFEEKDLNYHIFKGKFLLKNLLINTLEVNKVLLSAVIPIKLKFAMIDSVEIDVSLLGLTINSIKINGVVALFSLQNDDQEYFVEAQDEDKKFSIFKELCANYQNFIHKNAERLQNLREVIDSFPNISCKEDFENIFSKHKGPINDLEWLRKEIFGNLSGPEFNNFLKDIIKSHFLINDVHFRFEDDETHHDQPFAIGLSFDKVAIDPKNNESDDIELMKQKMESQISKIIDNSDYKEIFLSKYKHGTSEIIEQSIKIENFNSYMVSKSEMILPYSLMVHIKTPGEIWDYITKEEIFDLSNETKSFNRNIPLLSFKNLNIYSSVIFDLLNEYPISTLLYNGDIANAIFCLQLESLKLLQDYFETLQYKKLICLFEAFKPPYYPCGHRILKKSAGISPENQEAIKQVNKLVVREWLLFGHWSKHVLNLILQGKPTNVPNLFAQLHSSYLSSSAIYYIDKISKSSKKSNFSNVDFFYSGAHMYTKAIDFLSKLRYKSQKIKKKKFFNTKLCGICAKIHFLNLNISIYDENVELMSARVQQSDIFLMKQPNSHHLSLNTKMAQILGFIVKSCKHYSVQSSFKDIIQKSDRRKIFLAQVAPPRLTVNQKNEALLFEKEEVHKPEEKSLIRKTANDLQRESHKGNNFELEFSQKSEFNMISDIKIPIGGEIIPSSQDKKKSGIFANEDSFIPPSPILHPKENTAHIFRQSEFPPIPEEIDQEMIESNKTPKRRSNIPSAAPIKDKSIFGESNVHLVTPVKEIIKGEQSSSDKKAQSIIENNIRLSQAESKNQFRSSKKIFNLSESNLPQKQAFERVDTESKINSEMKKKKVEEKSFLGKDEIKIRNTDIGNNHQSGTGLQIQNIQDKRYSNINASVYAKNSMSRHHKVIQNDLNRGVREIEFMNVPGLEFNLIDERETFLQIDYIEFEASVSSEPHVHSNKARNKHVFDGKFKLVIGDGSIHFDTRIFELINVFSTALFSTIQKSPIGNCHFAYIKDVHQRLEMLKKINMLSKRKKVSSQAASLRQSGYKNNLDSRSIFPSESKVMDNTVKSHNISRILKVRTLFETGFFPKLERLLEDKLLRCFLYFVNFDVSLFDERSQNMSITLKNNKNSLLIDSVYEKRYYIDISGICMEFWKPLPAMRAFFEVEF